MSEHFTDRTRMMLGDEGVRRLQSSRVAVFGIGGVGGYATEALARAGVGELHLFDSDTVSVSNINRQIIATHDTVGMYKTEAAKDRILSINPDCRVVCHNIFYSDEYVGSVDLSEYDYIIDAIDSVRSKITLIESAKKRNIPIISAMGAGNKLDPTAFRVADISKTRVCPLAKAVRVALRKRGINHLKVVYSEEEAVKPRGVDITDSEITRGEPLSDEGAYLMRTPPASVSFVPSVMGLIMAGEVILDLSVRSD